jgi:hypothetical protein
VKAKRRPSRDAVASLNTSAPGSTRTRRDPPSRAPIATRAVRVPWTTEATMESPSIQTMSPTDSSRSPVRLRGAPPETSATNRLPTDGSEPSTPPRQAIRAPSSDQ